MPFEARVASITMGPGNFVHACLAFGPTNEQTNAHDVISFQSKGRHALPKKWVPLNCAANQVSITIECLGLQANALSDSVASWNPTPPSVSSHSFSFFLFFITRTARSVTDRGIGGFSMFVPLMNSRAKGKKKKVRPYFAPPRSEQ